MDSQEAENKNVENKSSGLFSLPAEFIKKLYSSSEPTEEKEQHQFTEDNVDEVEIHELSDIAKTLLSLINNAQKIFGNSEAFESVKKLAYEASDTEESNHVLIAFAGVLKNTSNKFVIEKQDFVYGLPLEILEKFKFSKRYQSRSAELKKQCKNIKSISGLNDSLQKVYELFYSVYQDAYSDKEELENFLFNVGAQISRIGDNLYTVAEEQASDFKVQGDLNQKMNEAVTLISNKIISGNDLSSLKNSVKEQLDALQDIVEEERKLVKAQEKRVKNNVKTLANQVNELKLEAQELRNKIQCEKEQALRDPLTNIYNRQAYNEKIDELLIENENNLNDVCLLIWDIDHFKNFNDKYGHVVGDKVLKATAEKLYKSLKDKYFLARYGGEEFVMLLPGLSIEKAKEFADQVRNEVSNIAFMIKGKQVKITVSCGITNLQKNDSEKSLFERADKALYEAKEEGRNRVAINKALDLT